LEGEKDMYVLKAGMVRARREIANRLYFHNERD